MAKLEHFTTQEIPYEILAKFGLTQEMIDDLPQNVMQRFLSSRATPVLPVRTKNKDGKLVESQARIYLVRLNDGSVDVGFAPQWMDKDLSEFSIAQEEKLMQGKVIIADMDGTGRCFVQFDETIKQVMAVPVSIIMHNIGILTRKFGLSTADKEALEDGGLIEMSIDNHIVSAGIDLNDLTGIRVADGDKMAWQLDAQADQLPKYNFGLFGCWLADDGNTLSYIFEEDYTPDIIEQLRRTMTMNATEAQFRQLKV